jgi:succinate-semialdehyde dehydrogenase / glutarate-semialdehyde dehydrogenase
VTTSFTVQPPAYHAGSLVAGAWEDGDSVVEVRRPDDDSLVGTARGSGADGARRAADAAASALPAWGARPARERSRILLAAADAIEAGSEHLGRLLARETGKRLPEALAEISLSAEYFRWFAEEARRPVGAVHPQEDPSRRHVSVTRPAGVVASLTPWNFPCSIQARKLAPALAAGCTVVARVSERAPLAATAMIRTVHEAGLPGGVLNLVHGPAGDVTDALLAHPAVRVVSFTGSTGIGRRVMEGAAARIVRPLLELGGNAAFVVTEDADLEDAVEGALAAKFRNAGQSCIAANRFLVHEAVAEEFGRRLAQRMDTMTLGSGLADPLPDLGPMIAADKAQELQQRVDEAVAAGGRLLTRRRDVPGPAWCAPALVAGLGDEDPLAAEEVFGPVAALLTYADEDDLVRRVNSTERGLANYLYAGGLGRAVRLAERFDCGIVGINHPVPTVVFAPMGGTQQSGIGREGSHHGLEEFRSVQYLSIGV